MTERENRTKRIDTLEAQFGTALNALQEQYPTSQPLKRIRLLKIMQRFNGDVDRVRKCLERIQAKENQGTTVDSPASRQQRREELRAKYAVQLADLAALGINSRCPCVLAKLEKHQGDATQVLETMKLHKERKDAVLQLTTKYADQVAQLEADGVKIKNKQLLAQLLDKANGQVDVVKQLLAEKRQQKKEGKVPTNPVEEGTQNAAPVKAKPAVDPEDLDSLRQLRQAGAHGNPMKILAVFHQCDRSIERTIARLEKEREEREQRMENRVQVEYYQ